MIAYFYRDKVGREIGPFDLVTLSKFRMAGVLDGDTPVRTADSAEWKPCREVVADSPTISAAPITKGPVKKSSNGILVALLAVVIVVIIATRSRTQHTTEGPGSKDWGNPVRVEDKQEGTTFLVGLKDAWWTDYGSSGIRIASSGDNEDKKTFFVVYYYKNLGPREGSFSLGSGGFLGSRSNKKVEIKTDKGHIFSGHDFSASQMPVMFGLGTQRRDVGGWQPKETSKIGGTGESAVVFEIPHDEVPTELITSGSVDLDVKLPRRPFGFRSYNQVFGFLPSAPERAVSGLIAVLQDNDESVRAAAMDALEKISPPTQETVPATIAELLRGRQAMDARKAAVIMAIIRRWAQEQPLLAKPLAAELVKRADTFAKTGSFDLTDLPIAIAEEIYPEQREQYARKRIQFLKTRLENGDAAGVVRALDQFPSDLNGTEAEIGSILLQCSNELIERNPQDFRKAMALLVRNHRKIGEDEEPMAGYLYGAYLWLFESKRQALSIFRSLPPDMSLPCIAFASKPLETGTYPVDREVKKDDFWSDRGFTLALTSIEVSSAREIAVNITVRNPTKGKQTFFVPMTDDETKRQADELERSVFYGRDYANKLRSRENDFYLLDDLGNKLFPKNTGTFFKNWVNKKKYTDYYLADLDPGQEWDERIVFPMVGIGSSSVTFVLAEYPGYRPEVKFEDIILRKVLFSKFPAPASRISETAQSPFPVLVEAPWAKQVSVPASSSGATPAPEGPQMSPPNTMKSSAAAPPIVWTGRWRVNNQMDMLITQESTSVRGTIKSSDGTTYTISASADADRLDGSFAVQPDTRRRKQACSLNLRMSVEGNSFSGTMKNLATGQQFDWMGRRVSKEP